MNLSIRIQTSLRFSIAFGHQTPMTIRILSSLALHP